VHDRFGRYSQNLSGLFHTEPAEETQLHHLAATAVSTAEILPGSTFKCAKPDPVYSLEAGDAPNHHFYVLKAACVPTQGIRIAGVEVKDVTITASGEVSGDRDRGGAVHVSMMANNDQVFARSITTGRIQNGRETFGGTWTFVGGTGKFKNLRGKGTYQCKPAEDGGALCTSSGSYLLSASHD
jgi:hypothetical protein